MVHPSVPATNVQELIAYAKQHPDKLSYASSGNGAFAPGRHPVQPDGRHADHAHPVQGHRPGAERPAWRPGIHKPFTDILTALPHIKAGKLRAIGLASAQRSDALPDLPTISEQGLNGYDVSVFFGIVAPKDTPAATVNQLNQAFRAALADPDVKQALQSQGIVAAQDQSPAALTGFIAEEVPKWRALIKSANVSID